MFDQRNFRLRCEWGAQGVAHLAPISEIVVIVDVLSFSTSVEIATTQGALVFPYRFRDETAVTFAASVQAQLATFHRGQGFSLSPHSLLAIPPGTRLVLPSPNGATLSLGTGETLTVAGCWRNAQAVADFVRPFGSVAVIPAGERWPDGSLRPSWEDWVGAGAILARLASTENASPMAAAAIAAFRAAQPDLPALLAQCGSGQELLQKGYAEDVALAAQLNASTTVPVLRNSAYQAHAG